jgi:hypothetical protein
MGSLVLSLMGVYKGAPGGPYTLLLNLLPENTDKHMHSSSVCPLYTPALRCFLLFEMLAFEYWHGRRQITESRVHFMQLVAAIDRRSSRAYWHDVHLSQLAGGMRFQGSGLEMSGYMPLHAFDISCGHWRLTSKRFQVNHKTSH